MRAPTFSVGIGLHQLASYLLSGCHRKSCWRTTYTPRKPLWWLILVQHGRQQKILSPMQAHEAPLNMSKTPSSSTPGHRLGLQPFIHLPGLPKRRLRVALIRTEVVHLKQCRWARNLNLSVFTDWCDFQEDVGSNGKYENCQYHYLDLINYLSKVNSSTASLLISTLDGLFCWLE